MGAFSWNNFDDDFIISVVYSVKTKKHFKPTRIIEDKDMLIPDMDRIAPYPTKDFIITYREEIESKLLIKHPELVEKIFKDVKGIKTNNYRSMLSQLSKMPLGNLIINRYISALSGLGSLSFSYDEISPFALPITIDLSASKVKEIPLYDFQKSAINSLNNNLITSNNKSGMLVMPTGSGKTRASAYFLLENLVSNGYQVIWLTHRHMLIDQTASAFYRMGPLVKNNNSKAKKLKIVCVSSEHSSIRATEKGDDILIISVQSGFRGLDYLKAILGKKVIIVVDEAHHTVAMSYRRIIDYIRKYRKDTKLLGLTATPVRGNDDESIYLRQLYDNNFIYSISMSELITKKILADPVFEKIETNTNFEPIITIEEADLIKKFGELPSTLANKIAQSSERNQIIVDTYMKDKDRYGKTLIFALNKLHCYTLNLEFKARGIKSDFVFSGNSDNELKIKKFKDNELDVLININILTEGSDVPDIQTIFLTRPTQSEGLLIQMIGRGLRGKNAGGTEKAIIVDFCDKWDTFNKWLSPIWVIGQEKTIVSDKKKSLVESEALKIPWETIREIYESITFNGNYKILRQIGLPFGWYKLLDFEDQDYTMLIWKDQLPGFRKVVRDKKEIVEKGYDDKKVISKYFSNFNSPPNMKDISIFLNNLINFDETPKLFKFEKRDIIDPVQIAKKLKEENIGIGDIDPEIVEIYNENQQIIQNIFGDLSTYTEIIKENLLYSNDKSASFFHIEEFPVELLPYKIVDTHNLEELMQEVIDEMCGGTYEGIENISWTDKPYRGFFGRYFITGAIQINKILDSPQVGREVIKFLIYHELLHRDYYKHDKSFYREEHKYPNYTEHNRFLDYQFGKFKLEM